MPYANLLNCKLYYEVTGSGEPVVMIHGSLSTGGETYSKQVDCLSSDYRCIVPDLRGHGKSMPGDTSWMMWDLADDVAELLENLGVGPVHVIGHSMGGDVAMYLVTRHPQLAKSLVLISDAVSPNEKIAEYIAVLHPDVIDQVKNEHFIRQMKDLYGPKWRDLIIHTIQTCTEYPQFTDQELENVKVPVLLLRGGMDDKVLDSEVDRLLRTIADFRWYMVEKGDHFLHGRSETADEANTQISAFLKNCSSSTAKNCSSSTVKNCPLSFVKNCSSKNE